jgi:hypothetical protein
MPSAAITVVTAKAVCHYKLRFGLTLRRQGRIYRKHGFTSEIRYSRAIAACWY